MADPISTSAAEQALALRTAKEFKAIRKEISSGGLATDASKVTYKDGKTVAQALDDLNYSAIAITAFTNTVNTVESGSTVTDVTLNYAFNKTPTALTLDKTAIDVASTKQVLAKQTITANKTWTLEATDERGAKASKTTGISFLNGAYYGVGKPAADAIDSAFVLTLTKVLTDGLARDFKVSAADGNHIFYAFPHRFGSPSFWVGGFEGGFDLVKTFDFTNASGYTESYDVYESANADLGDTTVTVKQK